MFGSPAIFLKGNVSEGFRAFGPYEDADEAMDLHDGEEGWMMELHAKPAIKEKDENAGV